MRNIFKKAAIKKFFAFGERVHLVTLILIVVFLAVWIYVGKNRPGRQSPREVRPANPHVEWAISDHYNAGLSNVLLENDPTDPATPNLNDRGVVLRIPRDNNSNYNIPRFQGEIIYDLP